ncbi:MAG: CGNR zinc finger domain-containing protein [Propionibacteriaceae bacterium]|nr:hypothetical protein [Propionibacteriaceae bacterium]HBY21958.1 hypothetical protein [Propionibacteriaceae bacterium]
MPLDYAWLGQGLALDLVNTFVPAQNADIVDRWPGLAEWQVGVAQAIDVRRTATTAIDCLIAEESLSSELRHWINSACRIDPEVVVLTDSNELQRTSGFVGSVARDLVRLASGGTQLRRCHAPGCGMVFERGRGTQQWCSGACGNRARVARHTARREIPKWAKPEPPRG